MGTILSILDLLVVLLVVISVAQAVWKGPSSLLLSGLVVLAMLAFGLVSFVAAWGLAGTSLLTQGLLFVGLGVIAILSRAFWANQRGAY